jgi:hypothetical protein
MHMPRIQFKLGTLLFAVAVLAVNWWAFRCFYESRVMWSTPHIHRILPPGVGILPLVNVVLIGTLVFAVRLVRSLATGGAARPGRFPSGVAYFSLHFLILGCVVTLYQPIESRDYELISFERITEYAAEGWDAVFGEPRETVPWIILQSSILCFLISGPPLALSWIGHILAKRAAATLPRRRFQAMTCLVSLGFAGAGLAICVTPQPFEEEREIELDFLIVDEDSGRPVASAFVSMSDPFSRDPEPKPSSAFTDGDGHARLTGRFVASGERNAFQIMGVFSPWGRWLEVSAADRRTRRIPLTDVLGQFADPAHPSPVKVTLARGEATDDAFHDIAGVYATHSSGFHGSGFVIEKDGRFAWSEWGCVPPDSHECGYLKRHGHELELVLIPHPGREIDPLATVRYRVTEWGSRL